MEVYCGRKYGAYEEWDTSSYEEAGDGESFDKDRRDDAEDSFCIQLVLVPTFKWHVAALWLSIFLANRGKLSIEDIQPRTHLLIIITLSSCTVLVM